MNTLEIFSNLLMYLPSFAFNTASVKFCLLTSAECDLVY